jgi:hypothetical protein
MMDAFFSLAISLIDKCIMHTLLHILHIKDFSIVICVFILRIIVNLHRTIFLTEDYKFLDLVLFTFEFEEFKAGCSPLRFYKMLLFYCIRILFFTRLNLTIFLNTLVWILESHYFNFSIENIGSIHGVSTGNLDGRLIF